MFKIPFFGKPRKEPRIEAISIDEIASSLWEEGTLDERFRRLEGDNPVTLSERMDVIDRSDKWLLVRSVDRMHRTSFACYPVPELSGPFFRSAKVAGGPQSRFPGSAYALVSMIIPGMEAEVYWFQGGFVSQKVVLPEGFEFGCDPLLYYGRFGNKLVGTFLEEARQSRCGVVTYRNYLKDGGRNNTRILANNLLPRGYEVYVEFGRTCEHVVAADLSHPRGEEFLQEYIQRNSYPGYEHITRPIR